MLHSIYYHHGSYSSSAAPGGWHQGHEYGLRVPVDVWWIRPVRGRLYRNVGGTYGIDPKAH